MCLKVERYSVTDFWGAERATLENNVNLSQKVRKNIPVWGSSENGVIL